MHNVVWGCAEILPIVAITCPRGEKKFGVSKKPCNILFIISTPTKYQSFHFSIFFKVKHGKVRFLSVTIATVIFSHMKVSCFCM